MDKSMERKGTTQLQKEVVELFSLVLPHTKCLPQTVFIHFSFLIFSSTTAENKNLATYKQMIRFLRKRKVFLLLNESFYAKYDIVVTFTKIIKKSNTFFIESALSVLFSANIA